MRNFLGFLFLALQACNPAFATINYQPQTFANSVTLSPLSTAGVILNSSAGLLSSSAGPLSSTLGGLGLASPTAHGVLVGEGSSAINVVSPGSSTFPLVSNGASSDASFQALSLTAGVTGVLPIANGGTNNGSLLVTAGGVLYTDGSKVVNVGSGTSTYLLQSNGSSPPTWVAPVGGVPNARYLGLYPQSGSNYWSNATTGASYADFTAAGTIPSPTVVYNTGFTTPSVPSSSRAGITFTAPYTGTLEITFGMFNVLSNSSNMINLRLYESSTSTPIGYGLIYPQGFQSWPWVVISGFLDVTASSSYTVTMQATSSTGTIWIGSSATANATVTPELQMAMHYIH